MGLGFVVADEGDGVGGFAQLLGQRLLAHALDDQHFLDPIDSLHGVKIEGFTKSNRELSRFFLD